MGQKQFYTFKQRAPVKIRSCFWKKWQKYAKKAKIFVNDQKLSNPPNPDQNCLKTHFDVFQRKNKHNFWIFESLLSSKKRKIRNLGQFEVTTPTPHVLSSNPIWTIRSFYGPLNKSFLCIWDQTSNRLTARNCFSD